MLALLVHDEVEYMKVRSEGRLLRCIVFSLVIFFAKPPCAAAQNKISLMVGNESRTAILVLPKNENKIPCPVVFVFHGHGGNMSLAEKQFSCESYWPEAVVVYPQGLNTPGSIVDKKGNYSGWQENIGEPPRVYRRTFYLSPTPTIGRAAAS